jgi:tRNA(adenine34) deaminase
MRRAGETLQQFEFRGATLYSTLQPCGMCTMDFVFRDDLSVSGGLLSDECAALYIGPDEDVPKDEQYNR